LAAVDRQQLLVDASLKLASAAMGRRTCRAVGRLPPVPRGPLSAELAGLGVLQVVAALANPPAGPPLPWLQQPSLRLLQPVQTAALLEL